MNIGIQEAPDSYTCEPEGKSLRELLHTLQDKAQLLWSKRGQLGTIIAAAGVLSASLAMFLPKRFEAVAYLMPPDSASGMSGLSLLMGLGGRAGADPVGALRGQVGSALGLSSPGQLYMRALQSHKVEDRIIDRFDLMRVYGSKLRSDARRRLDALTDVGEDRKSGVIEIAVTDSDPNRAAQIANAYQEELDRLLVEVNTTAARRERQYYETELTAARIDMQLAARNLADFAGKNVAINVPEQGKAAVEAIAGVQSQLIAAETQLKGMLQIYNEGQGPIQTQRAQIAELRHQLAQLSGKQSGSNDAFPDVKKLSSLGVSYLDLYQHLKVQEGVVEALSLQYELAKMQESREVPSVRVLDPAEVPDRKSYPPRFLIVGLSTCVAFGCAVIWIIALEWWKSTANTSLPVRAQQRPDRTHIPVAQPPIAEPDLVS